MSASNHTEATERQVMLELDELCKSYQGIDVVRNFDLQLREGELISLLGPSGCGKTTTLRMIGGLIEPTGGRIVLRGTDITHQPPHLRDTVMVFQSYALFPHMSAYQNIAFGLRRRGASRQELEKRVSGLLRLLNLEGLADRLPAQLSGGQQQRVAVARALAVEPAVLLMDEPFSNLDSRLREKTSLELRRLQQELLMTVVLVTHDKNEALTISDKIAVMNKGRIEQIGSPIEVYQRPRTEFVARFVSDSNIFSGVVRSVEGGATVETDHGVVLHSKDELPASAIGDRVKAAIRPDAMTLLAEQGSDGAAANHLPGRVEVSAFQGTQSKFSVTTNYGETISVIVEPDCIHKYAPGANVAVTWQSENVVILAESDPAQN